MKKSCILTLFVLVTFLFCAAQTEVKEPKKTISFQKAYAYQEEMLLISETDNNCTFFIRRDRLPDDIKIIGSRRQDDLQTVFSFNEELFINSGTASGFKEGDMLLIIGKGSMIANPFCPGKLGTYYLKKSLATITCAYEDRAIISLKNTCNPVEIGDIVIPYKPEKTLLQKKLVYSLCRIPPSPLEGRVAYIDLVQNSMNVASTSNHIAVDLGEGLVEKGTFLLFYRVFSDELPPFIIGLGIVIHPESNVSTVKILDAYTDIHVGDRAVVLSETLAGKEETGKKDEIPIVETLNKEAEAKKGEEKKESEKKSTEEGEAQISGENRFMLDFFFDFDSKVPPEGINVELEKVASFISDKSEYVIILRGYCCSIGDDEYNLKLSKDRVEAIKNLLITQYKVDPAHIETYFYGEKEPQYDNTQEAQRKKNRLVKLEVVAK